MMFGKVCADGDYDRFVVEELDEELFAGAGDDGDDTDEAWADLDLDADGPDPRVLTWDEPDPALFDAD